jgi:hypothetical protein
MRLMIVSAMAAFGCSTKSDGDSNESDSGVIEAVGVAALGAGTQDLANVVLTEIGDSTDGLNAPRDLEFNPDVPGQLWVVSRTDDSTTIFTDAGTADQSSEHIVDPYAMHFMDNVSSIAFGAAMHEGSDRVNFGTCQESRNTYNMQAPPDDFMGPTLWSSDPAIFGESNPDAISFLSDMFGFYTDLGSHIDMLHESPLCMGIAHDYDNVYWVFDGFNESIYRYDFQEDHGPGYDDHGDGVMARYAEGEVSYKNGVPSHMVLDAETRLLYIADTGNNRIAILDTESGEQGDDLDRSEWPHTTHYEMEDTNVWTFIEGADVGMEAPSGIALVDGVLLVTDNQTSEVIAFDLEGEEVDRLALELDSGSLMGIAAVSLDELWLVDAQNDRVFSLSSN